MHSSLSKKVDAGISHPGRLLRLKRVYTSLSDGPHPALVSGSITLFSHLED
jgi:hypothetical protein